MTTTHQHPPATSPLSEAVLLHRAAGGDEAAFRAIYDQHVDAIRGYALGRVAPDAADDIVSETFTAAWRACARFDPTAGDARPWLYGIATNVVSRHRQREQHWMRQRTDVEADHGIASKEATAYNLDPALAHAVARLSPPLRDTLLLTALADLSVAEAGRALGITATTARVRLLRARRQLRAALRGDQHDPI